MSFKESLLRGRIDGLRRNIAITEKLSSAERIENLKRQLAEAEAELAKLKESH
ncbi:MAG: hypothetical protein ABSE46_08660 [Terracidiphilus sp.]|jgi:hypothetical protein